MLSDEELKEIESGKVPEGPKATPAEYGLKELRDILASDCGWAVDELYDRSEALLAEVKRLRSLMHGQTFTSDSGWQSVADGAKPAEGDYHVQFLTNPRDDGHPGTMSCMTGVYGFGGTFLSGCTHFLVIPPPPPLEEYKHRIDEFRQQHDPPPIKRES